MNPLIPIFEHYRERGYDREQRLLHTSEFLGREIRSFNQLTDTEIVALQTGVRFMRTHKGEH